VACFLFSFGLIGFWALPSSAAPQVGWPATDAAPHRQFLNTYCITCHNQRLKTAGLLLDQIDIAKIPVNAEVWEKVIRRLRAGTMPPQGMPKPEKASVDALASYLETSIDTAAAMAPNPGRASAHRMNRVEYGNAIRDLLALNVDTSTLLPADDASYGFDNNADVLKLSPILLERYLSAAWNVSRQAIGDGAIQPSDTTFRVRPDLSQDVHVEGLPLGTHGGLIFKHRFPLEGDYIFRVRLWRTTQDQIRGLAEPHQLEITLDGSRVLLQSIGGSEDYRTMVKSAGTSEADIDRRLTLSIPVKAGEHTVGVAFLRHSDAIDDAALEPFERTTLDPASYLGVPHIDRVTLTGPFDAKGGGDTASRRKIFVCKATASTDEIGCARRILSQLARQAFRRPVTANDMEALLGSYQEGRNTGTFETGIEMALRAILADPEFLFRLEPDPAGAAVNASYRLGDLELASRLAFFLWSSLPDEQLLQLATEGKLKDKAVLEQQVRRMLADRRSAALTDNFAAQWLYLRNLTNVIPDPQEFGDFDEALRSAFRRETEMFFESVIREDRSVLDLLNGNYTFVNERLARHYGIPNITGENFQRVTLADPTRWGLLGKGSTLAVTSLSNRTSPVIRGKWILTNILGTPPGAPPPNVPALKESKGGAAHLTLRQRMEQHRANDPCASCHKVMDPIGFAMENFDAVGAWRGKDEGNTIIDAAAVLADGSKINGPVGLREAIEQRPEQFARTVSEKLLTYALGRGLEYTDMPAVRSILREAGKRDYRFSSLVIGIVESTPFQMKKKFGKSGDQPVAGLPLPRSFSSAARNAP